MSCITQLLKLKGDISILPIHDEAVIEGGGEYKGYEYLITFVHAGHRCGYVALKDNQHEILAKGCDPGYMYPVLQVHGGVTFFDKEHAAKDLLPTHCDDFWVGFDAAHCDDAANIELAEKYFGETDFIKFKKSNRLPVILSAVHRTYQYMEQECKFIIDQLIDLTRA
jgi:hypothetical protein